MNIITTRAPNWPQVVWNGFQFDWFQLDRVIPHRGYVYSCTYTLLKISGQPVENLMIGLAMDEDGGHLSRYYVGRQVANQGGNCRLSCMLSTVSVAVIGLWAAPHHSHSLHSSSSLQLDVAAVAVICTAFWRYDLWAKQDVAIYWHVRREEDHEDEGENFNIYVHPPGPSLFMSIYGPSILLGTVSSFLLTFKFSFPY